MAPIISRDHSVFRLEDRVKEVSRELTANLELSYFQYLRCFSDYSIGLLANDTALIEYVGCQPIQESLVYSSFKEEDKLRHTYWFLWDEDIPGYLVDIARQKFNICHGITLVRRSKDYYDLITVALPYDLANAPSFYLNKLKAIEQFIIRLNKNEKELLSFMHKDKIQLPERHRDKNCKNICLGSRRIQIRDRNGMGYITAQEMECIRLLSAGLLQKEIAHFLNISPRSVATYLERARLRTGLSIAEIKYQLNNCCQ